MIHGGGYIIHRGMKKFTELSNSSGRGLNKSLRYEIIHGGG